MVCFHRGGEGEQAYHSREVRACSRTRKSGMLARKIYNALMLRPLPFASALAAQLVTFSALAQTVVYSPTGTQADLQTAVDALGATLFPIREPSMPATERCMPPIRSSLTKRATHTKWRSTLT